MKVNNIIQSALENYRAGNLEQSRYFCGELLKKQPNNPEILYLSGIICAQLKDYDSAIYYLKKTLQFDAKNADAYLALGTLLEQNGLLDKAADAFQKTLELKPKTLEAFYYLAQIFLQENRIDEAIACFRKVQQLDPNNAQLSYKLGLLLHDKGQFQDAIYYHRKAVELDPAFVDAYNGLGNALLEEKDFEEAIRSYQKAASIDASNPTAYINIGTAYHNMRKFDDAISSYRKALSLNPNLSDVYYLMGQSLFLQARLEEASESYRSALRIVPDSAIALVGLGSALAKQGKVDEAESYFQRARQVHPADLAAYEAFLMNMLYNPRYDGRTTFSEHLRFGDQCIKTLHFAMPSYDDRCTPERKLRIGYVSPDFRRHSVAFFIEPVLASHDRQQFEIFCYSSVEFPDAVTERIKKYTDNFRDIVKLSDEKAAELIHRDEIDILIDLAGYTLGNRTLLFARKPAPVQVSWIGYPATTGLPTMDYKIVDNYTDPPGMTEQFYSEKLIRLPRSFVCYSPVEDSPEVGDLPALEKGWITFCSFTNFAKISQENFAIWTNILNEVPNSRLIIKADSLADRETRNYAYSMFTKGGIKEEKIELLPFLQSMKEHLNLYNRVDISLDTFPYNGTTTTCEALWMGVPVITLAGNTHVSRTGASLLRNVGLPELIAETPGEYVAIASNLASDTDKLRSLRKSLRNMISGSPLMEARTFVMGLEDCYRAIWKKWCGSHT